MNRKRPQRILIRSANWVGDAVMSTAAVRGVRRSFPGARITLLAKPWVVPVFTGNPHIDDILVYDAAGRHAGVIGRWRLVRDLRKAGFDAAILLQNAFEAALLAWMAGIPERIGYATDGRAFLLTRRLWRYRAYQQGHLIDYYLGILAEAGRHADGRRLELFLTADEIRQARSRLERFLPSAGTPVIGVNPGAAFGTAKRWLPERFVALCRRLHSETGAVCLLFGSHSEAMLGRQLADAIGPAAMNLCGETTLRQAMALMKCCDVFVTNDSGLMHVAAALDLPQVAIIGPTDPVATGPSNHRSRQVQAVGACYLAPCLKAECPIDHRCMRAISTDRVYDEVSALLTAQRERRQS